MLASDDVSALVLEVGTSNTRAGYAGEDCPRAVFSTSTGILAESAANGDAMDVDGENSKNSRGNYRFAERAYHFTERMEIGHPLENGLVSNWDLYEKIVGHSLNSRLGVNPSENPLVVCEPSYNTPEQRLKMAELVFEKLETPAFFVARSGVLTSFASGKSTALVVDVGGGMATVSPVYDGYVLKKSVMSEALAGNLLSLESAAMLEQVKKVNLAGHFKILRKKTVDTGKPADVVMKKLNGLTDSFDRYMKTRIAEDFKETVCAVSEFPFEESTLAVIPQKSFEFPTGYNGNFGSERFKIPELLFNPSFESRSGLSKDFLGLTALIQNCVNSCDIDIRPHLLSNIIVTGGSSGFLNFTDRLNNELFRLFPGNKIRIYSAGSTAERRFGSWIGGSILASLGTFQQLWISKQEYEEHGGSIVEKRCA